MKRTISVAVILLMVSAALASCKKDNVYVEMDTSRGKITLELFTEKAPATVENFLKYADSTFYEGTIFHRVIDNFMIQGGGFTTGLVQKQSMAPIKNEAANGLNNERGTIAMARTGAIDSATSQFFINVNDNAFLDHRDDTPRGYGYCVFGKVIQGMDVVDAVKSVPTAPSGMHQNVPEEDIVIISVKRIQTKK